MKTQYLTSFLAAFLISLSSFSQTVINGYAEVVGTGLSTITVSNVDESFDTFEDGEQVIIMQMQDNTIGTTSNSINFGNIGNIQSAGLYEVLTIASHTENGLGQPVNITFTAPLSIAFNIGTNTSVQMITFPELGTPNFTTTTDYTAKNWDGTTGGVVAFQVQGTLTLSNNIIVDGKGFRGGATDKNQTCSGGTCESTVYRTQWNTRALKGEGIYKNTTSWFEAARGRILNGAGGGSCHNGAGGGGSNFSSGGNGGEGWGCRNSALEAGGFGGLALGPYITPGRIFMGGGGGAGERNNGWNTAGGNGGGIILVKATDIITAGSCGGITISANGETTQDVGNDGAGGAGAGGTILFEVINWSVSGTCSIDVRANGGDGGSSLNAGTHGGGGGGGQGVIIYSNKAPSSGVTNTTFSGSGGCGNTSNPCNAIAGSGGGVPNGGVFGAGGGSPLPIELIYFTADLVEDKVYFGWETASEQNVDYYIIERQNEYGDWYEVTGADAMGNVNTVSTYTALDPNPQVGDNYYRLTKVDNNGIATSYNVVLIHVNPGQLGDVTIYPNPSSGIVNLAISTNLDVKEIVLFDVSGKLIRSIQINNQQLIEVDLTNLPKGVYFVKVNDEMKKLVLSD